MIGPQTVDLCGRFSDEELLLNKCNSSKPVVDFMAFDYQINVVQQGSTQVDFNVSMKQKWIFSTWQELFLAQKVILSWHAWIQAL